MAYVPNEKGCEMRKKGALEYAMVRIVATRTIDETNQKVKVSADLQVNSYVTFGEWTGGIRARNDQSVTIAKTDLGEWVTVASENFSFNIKDDGSFSYTIYGHLKAPLGTTMTGLYIDENDGLTRTFTREAKTITITYNWTTESGPDSSSITKKKNETFNLRSAPSNYSIEGATYTCTIDGGEGSYSGSSTRSSTHSTNYSFSNWKSSGGATYSAGASVSFTSNQTFTAQYSSSESHTSFYWPYKSDFSHSEDSSSFTITGAGNGGADRSISATEKTPYDISSSLSSSRGTSYSFGGYDYLIEGENGMSVYPTWTKGTPTYSNNKISDLGSTSREADSEIGYSVSFDYATGTIDQTINNSYTFEGWYNDASGGTKYPDATEFKSDATVYAHWTKTQKAEAIVLLDPDPKPGYEFLGWVYNGKTITGDDFASMIPTAPGESITLTASWKAKGLARIYVDGTYKQALCYIFDGTSYCQAMPYIYDGEKYRLGG